MKTSKLIGLLVAALMLIALAACTATPSGKAPSANSEEAQEFSPSAVQDVQGYEAKNLVGKPVDYADEANWARLPKTAVFPVDTFYIYPTVYSDDSVGAPDIAPIDDPSMRLGVESDFLKAPTLFSEFTNVYEPYYRQSNLATIMSMNADQFVAFQHGEQRTDIFAALDYYFEHCNQGRPFILAGHSQGSVMIKIALTEYFKEHENYLDRMVASYALGFSITEDDLIANPALKFAEGADDVGVIVSWNTEGAQNKYEDSFVVMEHSIAINPINWKRDETHADAWENLGSRIPLSDLPGDFQEDHPGLMDATVDVDRGVVVCTTMDDYFLGLESTDEDTPKPLGPASLHQMDYLGYWDNIKENVQVRIAAYFAR